MATNVISMLGDMKAANFDDQTTIYSHITVRSYITYKFDGSFHVTAAIYKNILLYLMHTRTINFDVAMWQCG